MCVLDSHATIPRLIALVLIFPGGDFSLLNIQVLICAEGAVGVEPKMISNVLCLGFSLGFSFCLPICRGDQLPALSAGRTSIRFMNIISNHWLLNRNHWWPLKKKVDCFFY